MKNQILCEGILDIIKQSNINLVSPEIRKITIDDNCCTEHMEFSDNLFGQKIDLQQNLGISCILMFSLFDAYIEDKYNMHPGESFRKRYQNIAAANTGQNSSNINIVIQECYRLMKVMRNASVHNNRSITINNNVYSLGYIYTSHGHSTIFHLDLSLECLRLLYSLIVMLVKEQSEIQTRGHFENIACTYYLKIKDFVDANGHLQDEFSHSQGLIPLAHHHAFAVGVRYQITNASYTKNEDEIKIDNTYEAKYTEYASDYCIKYNGKSYIIPEEILDENSSVKVSLLATWEAL